MGTPGKAFRGIQAGSTFGKLLVFVTDRHLPYPYGRETTGCDVDDLAATLEKAKRRDSFTCTPGDTLKATGSNWVEDGDLSIWRSWPTSAAAIDLVFS